MKLSDIVYPITKPNVEFAISIYHKKIFFSNAHRIPKDRPVFFISNHPTAFLEPLLYAALMDKPIHPLVRGDFFKNPTAKIALESLNMIAIYRMQDGGVEGLRKNAETFQNCYDLIANHKRVLIMAEGFALHQKRLAPLQKGAARMALGAAQSRKLDDLLVIPIGANFSAANTFRGEVMIEVGEPIEMVNYIADYPKDKKYTIDRLTDDMEAALKRTVVHVKREEDDALFEKLMPIVRRQQPSTLWPSWQITEDRFRLEKKCADKINESSEIEKQKMMDEAGSYPLDIALRSDRKIINWIVLITGFPLWLIGAFYRLIPFAIARKIVKGKVDEVVFESPVRFVVGVLFMAIWTLFMSGFAMLIGGLKWLWFPVAMLLVVWFSVIYDDVMKVVRHGYRWRNLSSEEKAHCRYIEDRIGARLMSSPVEQLT